MGHLAANLNLRVFTQSGSKRVVCQPHPVSPEKQTRQIDLVGPFRAIGGSPFPDGSAESRARSTASKLNNPLYVWVLSIFSRAFDGFVTVEAAHFLPTPKV
jgi:hypothetical protein